MEGAQGEAQLAELRERWQAATEGAGDWAAITAVREAANEWLGANGQPKIPWYRGAGGRSYTRPEIIALAAQAQNCLLYTSPSPRDKRQSRMPSSA